MKRLPLTVIVLVHRNDENLRKALQSVNFAEEIIIIDNNSGVEWSEFADLPLKVRTHLEEITNFSATRNEAIKFASQEWVFFLDSDEEVVQPAIPKFAAVLAHSSADTVVVHRSDVFYGKKLSYGEAGSQQLIRMGRKASLSFSGPVHEIANSGKNMLHSGIEILHHAHPNINEFVDDVSVYAKKVAQEKTTTFWPNLLELIFFPPLKFFYSLIIQGGIQDGWHGVVYAACMSLHSLLVRVYRYEIISNTQSRS